MNMNLFLPLLLMLTAGCATQSTMPEGTGTYQQSTNSPTKRFTLIAQRTNLTIVGSYDFICPVHPYMKGRIKLY
jgi:plastocyanin